MPQSKNTPGMNISTAMTEGDWTQRFIDAKKRGKNQKLCQIGKGDGLNPNATPDTGEDFTVWVRPYENPEPTVAYFRAGYTPLTTLANNLWFFYSIDIDTGKLWIEKPADDFYADVLNGEFPPTNGADFIHTHENDAQCGMLDASLVFNAGVVDEQFGGTGNNVYVIGDLLYASATGVLSRLADVATGNALISGGVGVAPSYGKIGLTTHVSGLLPLANGGTNVDTSGLTTGALIAKTATNLSAATLTANAVMLGGASGVPSFVAPGSSGNVLTSNGTTWTSAAPAGGTSGWTDDGTVVRLETSTDNVTIGSATDFGKLSVIGDTAADIQFRVRGATSQSAVLVRIEDDSANALFLIAANGSININESAGSAADLRVRGASVSALLYADVSAGAVGVGTDSPTARLHVMGTEDEIQLRVTANGVQISNNVLVIEASDGTDFLTIDGSGQVHINPSLSTSGTMTISSTAGVLFYTDPANNRLGIRTSAPNATLDVRGSAIFNENGDAVNFRVESDGNANALLVDGTNNRVGILNGSPAQPLDVTGNIKTSALLMFGSTASIAATGDLGRTTRESLIYAKASSSNPVDLIGTMWANTDNVTVTANGAPGTNVVSGGYGSTTIAAGAFNQTGRKMRIRMPHYWTPGATPRRMNVDITFGSTVIASVDTTVNTLAAGVVRPGMWEAIIACRATGASGSLRPYVNLQYEGANCRTALTSNVTIDLTASQAVKVEVYFNGTGESVTFNGIDIEWLN